MIAIEPYELALSRIDSERQNNNTNASPGFSHTRSSYPGGQRSNSHLTVCYNFRRLERCEIGHQPNAFDLLR